MPTIRPADSLPTLPPRPRDSHKGSFGHVLVIGGSAGMIGAVALASSAALRGGAGLVTFAAPQSIYQTIAGLCPCATSIPLPCRHDGQLAATALRQIHQELPKMDSLAVGPGMAVGPMQRNIVRAMIEQELPVVLDADGLNNLTQIDDWPRLRKCPLVLTPHPGEFARLTGRNVKEIQADRQNLTVEFASQWAQQAPAAVQAKAPLVLVLKGEGTVVTDSKTVYVNDTGNPGMATGGTGDVLTGLLAAFIGQKLGPFDAACLAVHCHGRAGDFAAAEIGEVSLIASDLLDHLAAAISQIIAGPF